MNKTKIEWYDSTLNPVVGCSFNCEYCDARRLNDRFKWIDNFNKPQFFESRLNKLNTRPQIIFMNSMSDIADWEQNWIDKVEEAMRQNTQHSYLFLTKRPEVGKFINGGWNGCSITREAEMCRFNYLPAFTKKFVSIEPILEDVKPKEHNILFKKIDWVIVGAETGKRIGKVKPKKEWIDSIVDCCEKEDVPIFMKDSLIDIVGKENMLRQFPYEFLF